MGVEAVAFSESCDTSLYCTILAWITAPVVMQKSVGVCTCDLADACSFWCSWYSSTRAAGFVFEVLPRVRFPLGELRHLWLDCFHCGSLWARPWPHLIISCSPST